jgi:hypothetical protein
MAVVTSCGAAAPAYAQAVGQVLIDSKSPFFPVTVTNDDAHAVKMPDLAYTPTAEDEGNYDKYFYFHRADTDYATAYADIVECDGYARGLSGQVSPIYGQGILGDAIGSAISDAIYGSANRRKVRRANMRACMGYKGYDRFGLSKPIWEAFNFEEGNKTIPEDIRTGFLKQQALVASSAQPQGKALGQ